MPFLVLVRHAKAEPQRPDDHGRRLTGAGRAQCGQLRAWLAGQGVRPDRVVVSSAARAVETWGLARVGEVEPVVDERLYQADVPEVRELVAETPDDLHVLVLVGHNPTFERLAWELDDSDRARDLTNRGLGTAGAAVFGLTAWGASWGRLVAWR